MKQILKLSALTMILLLVCALFAGAITKFENGAYEVNGIVDIDDYKGQFGYPWAEVLDEINREL